MQYWRAFVRLIALVAWLLFGVCIALVAVKVDMQRAYTEREQKIIRWWAGGLLRILAVRVTPIGYPVAGSVWVANHISWLDIVVLMSIMPCRFLSKAEVASWPLIGWLARRSGTVFLRRGNGETAEAMQLLGSLVQKGDSVLFFPEGTTTAGMPKAFHARLFALPIEMQKSVQPISLSYLTIAKRRADIAYVGVQSFIQNLWQLVKQPMVVAEVRFMPLIMSDDQSRKSLAEKARSAICASIEEGVEHLLQ